MLPGGWADTVEVQGCEVQDILYPDIGLLCHWAREHGLNQLAVNADPFIILEAMVADFKPDVVFIYAGGLFHITRKKRDALRIIAAKGTLFVGLWGDELCEKLYEYGPYFGDLDFVFTTSEAYTKKFEALGIPSRNIGNSFDPSIMVTPALKKDIDVLFCGSTGFGQPEHFNRYNVLKNVIPRINIRLYGNDARNKNWLSKAKILQFSKVLILKCGMILPMAFFKTVTPLLASRLGTFFFGRASEIGKLFINAKVTGIGPWILFEDRAHPDVGIYDFLKPLSKIYPKVFFKPVVNGSEYLTLLTRAKVVLNIHRDELADVGNIRCYETTGVGVCLLTDRRNEIADRFVPDVELSTFESADELVEKVSYLLSHDAEREEIAAAGQRRCLAEHTVMHRSKIIVEELRKLVAIKDASIGASRQRVLLAKYNTQGQPISYDVSFFLQAAEIKRQQLGCSRLVVAMLPPEDIHNQPGVAADVNEIVDGHARGFRMAHILVQMTDLMPDVDVLHLKSHKIDPDALKLYGSEVVIYPDDGIPHHSEYYQLVNKNPEMMQGFEASLEAHRYIKKWLDQIAKGRKVITLTLRQYKVDKERNNDMDAWVQFLEGLDSEEYTVVIIPDTDAVAEFRQSPLGHYPMFEPACFDVDLRFALYEQAFLNMFINNGPCVAASLSKKIDYLMFKLVVPNVPTTDPKFIKLLGFKIDKTPSYATPTQKWVWEDDTYEVIQREFDKMVEAKLKIASRDVS